MEERHGVRYGGRAPMPFRGALPPPCLHVFTNWKFSEPCCLGFVWRLLYVIVIG